MTSLTAEHWLVILVGLDVVLSLVSVGLALAEKKKPAPRKRTKKPAIGDVDPALAEERLTIGEDGYPQLKPIPMKQSKPWPKRQPKPKKEPDEQ